MTDSARWLPGAAKTRSRSKAPSRPVERLVKVLVSGGTGFVGRHLVPELARNHDVYCIVRRPSNLALGADRAIVADLTDPAFIDQLPGDVDVVVHLAQAYL